MKKILYPLETKKRELDGAILLAKKLVDSGNKVYIGPKRELNYQIDNIQPNVFIASNAGYNPQYIKLLSLLQEKGCSNVVIDTEGGVIIDEIYKKRHDARALKYCDLFFAWGTKGKELVIEGTGFEPNKIVVSGVPWFDLLSDTKLLHNIYAKEISIIKKEYGENYILYNSRFSGTNTFNENVKKEIETNYADNEYYRYSDNLFYSLNKSIKEIANQFPDKKIIIRPHPSEGKEFYNNEFNGIDNVFVDERFSVKPWILLSKLMLHNGCTTAIESALMNKLTISFMEIQNEDFDIHLPNNCSEQFYALSKLIERINKSFSEKENYSINTQQLEALNLYISNATQNATDIITKEINSLPKTKWKNSFNYQYFKDKIKSYILLNHLDKIKYFSKSKYNKLKSFQEYGFQKFEGLTKIEIENMLKAIDPISIYEINQISGTKDSFSISKKTI